MSPEITVPLGIPDVKVLEQEITENNELIIYVESTQETTPCGVCRCPIKCTYGKGQEIRLRHLSVLNLKTYICIRPKRGQCLSCLHDPTTTQIVSWYTQRSPHTNAFDEHLLKQLINSTIEDVSLKEEVGYDAVQGALNRHIATEINWDELKTLGTIGIDEVAMSKGHKNYFAIISTRQPSGKIQILAVLSDRRKAKVKEFLETIPERLHSTIQYFTTDMWDGYVNAIEEYIAEHDAVKASLVIDRFHVAQNYREDFDDLRKQEFKRLKTELPKETYESDCQGMLWTLRKNYADLNEDECAALRRLFRHSPQLNQAYTFRQELTAIFEMKLSVPDAKRRIDAWIRKVQSSSLSTFDGFIKTLQNHYNPILNYFKDRVTSGFVEGLNNKIKVIKRRCYGLRDSSTLFQRLSLDLLAPRHFSLSTT